MLPLAKTALSGIACTSQRQKVLSRTVSSPPAGLRLKTDYPHLAAWLEKLMARPAMQVPGQCFSQGEPDVSPLTFQSYEATSSTDFLTTLTHSLSLLPCMPMHRLQPGVMPEDPESRRIADTHASALPSVLCSAA